MKNRTARVLFKFDINKDIENWYNACNSTFMGVDWKLKAPRNTLAHIVGKPKKESKKFLKDYLKKRYNKKNKYVKIFNRKIKDYWTEREAEIFKRIEKITKKPIWPKRIICYYGTFPRGHYEIKEKTAWMILDPKIWYTNEIFCVSILHEILHFQFHKYFWRYCQTLGLNKSEIQHIKEATTFLINEEFQDLIPFRDWGYSLHKELRSDLSKVWKKEKDFQKLLNKSASLLKTKYAPLLK